MCDSLTDRRDRDSKIFGPNGLKVILQMFLWANCAVKRSQKSFEWTLQLWKRFNIPRRLEPKRGCAVVTGHRTIHRETWKWYILEIFIQWYVCWIAQVTRDGYVMFNAETKFHDFNWFLCSPVFWIKILVMNDLSNSQKRCQSFFTVFSNGTNFTLSSYKGSFSYKTPLLSFTKTFGQRISSTRHIWIN